MGSTNNRYTPEFKQRAVQLYQSRMPVTYAEVARELGVDPGTLSKWFNDFYAPYLNSKFSYAPLDPASDFSPLPESLDLSEVFRTRETRLARGCSISYRRTVYVMVDGDGVLLEAPDDTRLDVHVDAITEELYVERAGKRWACVPVARREGTGFSDIQDRRALQRLLSEMQCDGAVREG